MSDFVGTGIIPVFSSSSSFRTRSLKFILSKAKFIELNFVTNLRVELRAHNSRVMWYIQTNHISKLLSLLKSVQLLLLPLLIHY
jgi:hypothetical protein